MNLLSPQASNAKLSKNAALRPDWETWILYLAPADTVPGINVCPAASPGCKSACLFTAGRGQMSSVVKGRVRKTVLFRDNMDLFMEQMVADLNRVSKRAFKTGVNQAIRLNGTSDLAWERFFVIRFGRRFANVMEAFPELQFYDYTKRPDRANGPLPSNYSLTFSRSEVNESVAKRVKANIAVVFHASLPPRYMERPVIDGTLHDMRFLDPKGVIVGLLAKGKAKKDDSGFAVK